MKAQRKEGYICEATAAEMVKRCQDEIGDPRDIESAVCEIDVRVTALIQSGDDMPNHILRSLLIDVAAVAMSGAINLYEPPKVATQKEGDE